MRKQSGVENVAVGHGASAQQNGGSTNTSIGALAGYQITTGDNNLSLGHDAARTGSPGGAVQISK